MRKFLLTIIFSFCFIKLLLANDIRDFQIEGMSIGDSALNFFSKEELEIKKKNGLIYKKDDYFSATFVDQSFKTYNSVQLHIKKDDPKYIIHSIGGQKNFGQNRIKECYQDQKKAMAQIKNFFKLAKIDEEPSIPWAHDNSSKVKSTYIRLKSGDEIALQCYDHPEGFIRDDYLTIAIDDKEFVEWLYN